MGLDITAVSKLRKIEIPEGLVQYTDEYYDWEEKNGIDVWTIHDSQHFDYHLEGIEPGFYVSNTKAFGFRAGSYGGYGQWRNLLAKTVGYEGGAKEVWVINEYGGTATELINFSDADGVIGPITSKKLYDDFVNHEKQIMKRLDSFYLKMEDFEIDAETYDWFKKKYNDWKEAFRIASDNGAVFFH
jgi:hypothetical protein